MDSPVEKPDTQSGDRLFKILSSISTLLTGIIEGKDIFKLSDKPQLRDAL